MASVQTVRTVIGVIGNVLSFFLFLAPCPTFWKIYKWKSTQHFSGVPYVITLLNCLLWIFYGLPIVHPNSTLIITTNGIGAALEMSYICLFLFFASGRQRVKTCRLLAAVLAIYTVIVMLTLALAHTIPRRTLVVGSICVVIGTCMYAAPLTIMKFVIMTKSVKYMPFLLSLASCLNGLSWTAYAVVDFDIFIIVPNGLGTLLGAAQLVLYAIYYDWRGVEKGSIDSDGQMTVTGDITKGEQVSQMLCAMNSSNRLKALDTNGFYDFKGGDAKRGQDATVVDILPSTQNPQAQEG